MVTINHKFCVINGELCAVLISCFVLLLSLTAVVDAIRIKSILVPDRMNINSSEPLHLDCQYEFTNNLESSASDTLILKWFLNETLIYQKSKTKVFTSNLISKRLSQDVKNSTNSMLLTILNKTIELTGLYTCKVELTVVNETVDVVDDSKAKYMHTYVPTDEINLTENLDEESDKLNVICSAEGVYPEPSITLIMDNQRIQNATEYVVLNRNPLYDINAIYSITASNLPAYTVFNCSLSIPEVNWTKSRTLFYVKTGFGDGYRVSTVQEQQIKGVSSIACCNANLIMLLLWLPFLSSLHRLGQTVHS